MIYQAVFQVEPDKMKLLQKKKKKQLLFLHLHFSLRPYGSKNS